MTDELRQQQRRRARRTTLVLLCVVLAIYVGSIYLSVHRSHS